jgi:DHA2 family multidrug resistance protein
MSDANASGFDASRSSAGDRSPWLLALVVSFPTFMEVLDISIANVSLRNIAGGLSVSLDQSTWILTSYLVANAVILPISGWLATVIGRKRFYLLSVALFTVSSVLCGMAPSLMTLVFFRVLQGLGGGGMVPTGQAMLADSFPPRQRGQAFALFGIAVVVAPTIGPTLGGWITDNFTWHWIFFINGPVGIMSLFLVYWLVVEPAALERERKAHIADGIHVDWIGFLLVALFLGCLEVVLDKGERLDWFQSDFIVAFALVSGLSLVLFIPWELSREKPIVDVRLFGMRQFGTSSLMMLATGAVLFGSTQQLPQLLQTIYGYTAFLAGLVLLPAGVVMLMTMPIAGALSARIQPKYLMVVGMLALAYGMWHTAGLSASASFGFFVRARVLQTCGLAFLFIPITAASYAGLPPNKTNDASALINVARNLGGSLGVSLANHRARR